MILESALFAGLAYTSYRCIFFDKYNNDKIRKEANQKWTKLMDSLGNKSKNDICQEYELLEIFPKHYGFDAIVSIPFGKKFMDIVGLIPAVESCYMANVMVNTTSKNNTGYIRVHFIEREISTKDKLRFNWFKTFYNCEGCMTKSGETITIDSTEEIKSPTDDVVGYKIKSKIPVGLSYEKIKSSYDTITKTLGKCFFDFDYKNMLLETSIVHLPMSDDYKFVPIKIKPWELYIAMGYDWIPVILDYSVNANSLIGGMQGTGKTNALMAAFINLCNQCNGDTYEDGFDLMVCNMGEKNDLRIFKDVKQCKIYANNESEVLRTLKYLKKEMDRRNKLFSQQKSFCFNIHQYNKLIKDETKKLKVIHLIGDEIADFMCNEEIQGLLWDLIRKSRSSGIYITMATQRGSLKNLDSEIKGQFGNQICFSQPNTASALTIMSGEDIAKKVLSLEKNRECLVDYTGGVKVAKTLYLDGGMMESFLNGVIVDNSEKLLIDDNGNIKQPQVEEPELEVTPTDKAKNKEDKKTPRFTNFKNAKKGAKNK